MSTAPTPQPKETAASAISAAADSRDAPGFEVLLNAALLQEPPLYTKRPRAEDSGSARDGLFGGLCLKSNCVSLLLTPWS